jgi:hypothetical protein
MHPESLSRQYSLLQAEIRKQLSSSQKWCALPAMLDQLDTLRTQYLAATRSINLLTEGSERVAFRKAVH